MDQIKIKDSNEALDMIEIPAKKGEDRYFTFLCYINDLLNPLQQLDDLELRMLAKACTKLLKKIKDNN